MTRIQPYPDHLTTKDLCTLAGITYRQADYWCRLGWLHADNPEPGSGHTRRHPWSEARVAHALGQLMGAGCTQGHVAACTIRALPDCWHAPVLLDGQGHLTDDLDRARWVVQPHPELSAAA